MSIRRGPVAIAVALAVIVTAAVPDPAAGHGEPARGQESTEAAERTGVGFDRSPGQGRTGTAIEVSGRQCLLRRGVPGEGVVVRLRLQGRIVAFTTLAVARDGRWSGSLVVPVDAPVGAGWLSARCVYPAVPDPVAYTAQRFTVTGRGTAPEATPTPPRFNGGIEHYGAYDGQSTCSPDTKPGMARFMRMVMSHFGGSSLGVSRACGAGGTSEHKEGRAWDWRMNANLARDRNRVQALMNWLFATDVRCRHHANARRLGMMYIIWNRRMFRMYDIARGWAPYAGPNPHTDHVHFSLTRAGGAGRVSYWNPVFRANPRWNPALKRVRDVRIGARWSDVRPVTGDFDGDGRHDLLWYDADDGGGMVTYVRHDGRLRPVSFAMGPGRVPLVGDFNGDCRDDIIWYGRGAMPDRQWQGQANRRFRVVAEDIPGTYGRPVAGDFNGDRVSDIIWYGPGPAGDALWQGTPYGFVRRELRLGGDFRPIAGDFDGDTRDDLLLHGPGGAPDRIWWGRRNGDFAKRNITVSSSADPLVGDFNGDDRFDIFWYRPGPGADRVWLGRDDRRFQAKDAAMGRRYALPAAGDFDGDLQDDVFWHASPDHDDRIWSY